ncbi:hypothetical protein O1M63_54475 [Streptomyces mirabilis]|nr:hypothetical protein [Streptomyces mirabilis]
MHSGQAFGPRQSTRHGAGRDDDAVGADLAPVGEPDGALGAVESGGTSAEQPLRPQVLVVRLQREIRLAEGAGQELLGQRGLSYGRWSSSPMTTSRPS